MKIDNVFRDRDIPKAGAPSMTLPIRKASTIQTTAKAFTPSVVKSPSPARSMDEDRSSTASPNSWAAVGKNGVEDDGFKTFSIAPKKTKKMKFITFNAEGQRLDDPLPVMDRDSVRSFDERVAKAGTNLCNKYHLDGKCANTYCTFEHGPKLTAGELNVLKHKSRGLKCAQGTHCERIDCNQGHHCKFQGNCDNLSCKFKDLHGVVDQVPVSRWYEDGNEEYI